MRETFVFAGNDLDGARAEHCGARVYLGNNYLFGAEPAAAHSTP